MQNISKQFGAKDTASFNDRFNDSLLRLTIIYALTLAVILLISGSVTYSAFSNRIGHRFGEMQHITIDDQRIVMTAPVLSTADQVREDLLSSLIVVNGCLLLLAILLGYGLARRTLQPIKDSYEQQQRFLADASHELRTPIAILQLDLENALEKTATTKGRAREKSNLEEVHRMGKLVNDLLLLSRLDDSKIKSDAVRAEIILTPFLETIVSRLQPLANAREVVIVFETSHTHVRILANEELLLHAITNFVQNAIVYNKSGGVVSITIDLLGKKVCVTIADTGVGISAEDLEKIFNRFYRADKSRSRMNGGNGLGLSIAQSIIESSGGSIGITSEVDKGTVVRICFPRV